LEHVSVVLTLAEKYARDSFGSLSPFQGEPFILIIPRVETLGSSPAPSGQVAVSGCPNFAAAC
jgi:hypothetical protein